MADPKIAKDEAFGIVPIFQEAGIYKYLLIQHHAGHWGFPKGHADAGETPLQAACREFVEETGISDFEVVGEVTFSEKYGFSRSGQRYDKTVIYYLANVKSSTVSCQVEEIQNYAWLEFDAAIARLTFEGAKRVLREVYQHLQNELA